MPSVNSAHIIAQITLLLLIYAKKRSQSHSPNPRHYETIIMSKTVVKKRMLTFVNSLPLSLVARPACSLHSSWETPCQRSTSRSIHAND